jgi:hypothetical protein
LRTGEGGGKKGGQIQIGEASGGSCWKGAGRDGERSNIVCLTHPK